MKLPNSIARPVLAYVQFGSPVTDDNYLRETRQQESSTSQAALLQNVFVANHAQTGNAPLFFE